MFLMKYQVTWNGKPPKNNLAYLGNPLIAEKENEDPLQKTWMQDREVQR
jgi:hypothetical protein